MSEGGWVENLRGGFLKICDSPPFFLHCWRVGRVGAASELCRRHVGACRRNEKKKKKKRTLAGHRYPASRTRSGVRHVSDTDTTPKMACPCNLAFCALNYNPCYTLHSNVNFTIMFDKNFEHVTRRCLLLKWHKVKRPKPHLPNQLKFKNFFHYFLPSSLSSMRV